MKTDWTIQCAACGLSWTIQGGDSVYEREAIESRPCPHCHSYTLGRSEALKPRRTPFRLPIRKRPTAVPVRPFVLPV